MDFDQTINQVKETLIVTTELQRRYGEGQDVQPGGTLDARLGFDLHVVRMKYVDMRLASIDESIDDMRLASIDEKMRRMRDRSI